MVHQPSLRASGLPMFTPATLVATALATRPRGEIRVVASDPLTALALATIVQVRGEEWQASDDDIEVWLPRLTG
jgi:hypothetical protein